MFLIKWLFFLPSVQLFITRLPCMYHASFQKQTGKRKTEGEILVIAEKLLSKECGYACLKELKCVSYNYQPGLKTCELLLSDTGNLNSDDQWEYFATDTSNSRVVGPNCFPIFPCERENYCKTVCEPPGFTCINTNVVKPNTATAQQSTTNYGQLASHAVDGDYSTSTHTIENTANSWWKMEMDKAYPIKRIGVVTQNLNRIRNYRVYVSTDDSEYRLCGVLQAVKFQGFDCEGPGKYVKIADSGTSESIQLYEVEVFVAPNEL